MPHTHAPRAKQKKKVLSMHGHTRVDEYAWMREDESSDVIEYLEAENRHTTEMTRHLEPLQKQLIAEMQAWIPHEETTLPVKIDDYFYYSRTEPSKKHPITCRKKYTLDSPEEVIFDQDEFAHGYPFFMVWEWSISPDHKKLAYSVDFDGSEQYTIFVLDLETKELLPDCITNTHGAIVWTNDSRAFFYVTVDETFRCAQVYKHILGISPHLDVLVYEEEDERFHVSVSKTRSKAFILICVKSMRTSEVYYARADRQNAKFRLFLKRKDGCEYYLNHWEDSFLITINDRGKNFRIVKTSASKTSRKYWEEIIPHRDDTAIEGTEVFRNHLIVYERKEGLERIRIFPMDSTISSHEIELHEPLYKVSSELNPDYASSVFYFRYSSPRTPAIIYAYDVHTRKLNPAAYVYAPKEYDSSLYEMEKIFASSPDGTRVPISLVWKRGLKRDGSNPLFLYGYGAYGASTDMGFSQNIIGLLDRGFIYAVAHVRGGGEMGPYWHEEGKLLQKKNSFTDFIACAEYLIEQGYTSKGKIVIYGASGGGVLMGAVLNMRPDLWAAAVATVPFVDVINTMLDPTIPLVVREYEEWGNPHEATFYYYMLDYSPYEQVREQEYPKILVVAGFNDPRVQYWEPAKWVARLRARKTDSNLLFFKVHMDSGHFYHPGKDERLQDAAFEYAFIIDAVNPVSKKEVSRGAR